MIEAEILGNLTWVIDCEAMLHWKGIGPIILVLTPQS